MYLERLEDAMRELFCQVPVVRKRQIQEYFRAVAKTPKHIDSVLRTLVSLREITIDEAGICRKRSVPQLNPQIEKTYLYGFWPIAYLGADKVSSIQMLHYPNQFFVIRMPENAPEEPEVKCNNILISRDDYEDEYLPDWFMSDAPENFNPVFGGDSFIISVIGSQEAAYSAAYASENNGSYSFSHIRHVAMVYNEPDAYNFKLKECGFDCYCLMNKDRSGVEYNEFLDL